MRRCVRLLGIVLFLMAVVWALGRPASAPATAEAPRPPASTRSFTNGPTGTDPGRLTISGDRSQIVVDLSPLYGETIYRATLDPYVNPRAARERYRILAPDGAELPLRAPRFVTFDATAAVQAAVAAGQPLTLTVASIGQGLGSIVSLDVMSSAASAVSLMPVLNASVYHREGDTLLTFSEVDPPNTGATWTSGAYRSALAAYAHDRSPKYRYRIYRSLQPITDAASLAAAELIDEILPLSGWNGELPGTDPNNWRANAVIPLLPIDDFQLAAPGSGVYVRRFAGSTAETAYYFVSYAVNGAEDFTWVLPGVNTTAGVTEQPGDGMALKWKSERVVGQWFYTPNMDMRLDYYVRWPAAPDWPQPNRPFNYRLGVPMGATAVANPPLTIDLHAWGEHFDRWSRWPYYSDGALLLTANLDYYNAYTAFHEHIGTLKSWDDGTAQPFFQARMLDFIDDVVIPAHNIDTNRIVLFGESMGGAGAHMWGMRSGRLFSHVLARVGHNVPAEDPHWVWQFEQVGGYGPRAWNVRYSNRQLERFGYPVVRPEDQIAVWDYFDNRQWLRAHPNVETPPIVYSNGVNDPVIGWTQAWEVTQALVETERALIFSWGMGGHGEPLPFPAQRFRRDQSVPAFTNGSLDDDLGAAPDRAVSAGQLNRYVRWNTETIVDLPHVWEMDLYLDANAPGSAETVDVTPRRLQQFRILPFGVYAWEISAVLPTADGWPVGVAALTGVAGVASADQNGLLTVPDLLITKTPQRLRIVFDSSNLNERVYLPVVIK